MKKVEIDQDPGVVEARDKKLPRLKSVGSLRKAAAECHACPLWKHATQTVFGEGAEHARVMLVGEQPGDKEDLEGAPFVGPAGKLLRQALGEADIDMDDVYITNAVKHFKFEQRGKRRLHKKPNTTEVRACYPWLKREMEVVQPKLVVLMGATAALSVFGKATGVGKSRGRILTTPDGLNAVVTVHPSSLLRIPDAAEKEKAYRDFVKDFGFVKAHLKGGKTH